MQGVTFACVNAAVVGEEEGAKDKDAAATAAAAESKDKEAGKLATYALRIKSPDVLQAFIEAANAHKAGGAKAEGADA